MEKSKKGKGVSGIHKRNSGTWKRIKTIRKTSFIYKAKRNGKFSFKVRALKDKKKGKFSKVKKVNVKGKPAELENKKLAVNCNSTITAAPGDKIVIKATGTDVNQWTEWDYPAELFLQSGPDYGSTFNKYVYRTGKGTIKVTTESGETIKIALVVNKAEEVPKPRKTIDGVEFDDYTEHFGRTFDLSKGEDKTAGVLSPYPHRYAVYSKVFDINKVSVKVDYNGNIKYVTYSTIIHDNTNKQNYPRAYSGAIIKNTGSILLQSANFSNDSDYTGPNDFNWEGMINVVHGSFCTSAQKVRVRIYYGNTLLDDYYWKINPKSRNNVVEYMKQQSWSDNMTNYEKLEAVAQYIADNYVYSNDTSVGYDCHSCWIIQDIASKDLGLNSVVIHESGYQNPNDMTGSISLYGGIGAWGHTATIVEIGSQLYVFHTYGGGYCIEELERKEPDDGYLQAYRHVTYNGEKYRVKVERQYGNIQFSDTSAVQ